MITNMGYESPSLGKKVREDSNGVLVMINMPIYGNLEVSPEKIWALSKNHRTLTPLEMISKNNGINLFTLRLATQNKVLSNWKDSLKSKKVRLDNQICRDMLIRPQISIYIKKRPKTYPIAKTLEKI